jgi:hypothetical protein
MPGKSEVVGFISVERRVVKEALKNSHDYRT